MPRPKVSLDTERRLMDMARDVDDLSPNPSHEEALIALLDHIENLEERQAETLEQLEEQLNNNQSRQGRGTSPIQRNRGGGWTG